MSAKIKDIVSTLLVIIIVGAVVFVTMYDRKSATEDIIIGIHIKGEVNAPGYYELKYESRIKDAINLAGGETDKADLSEINLALLLRDGEEIVIPSMDKKENKDGKININTADQYTLCKLDGIGNSLANEIIEYRAKNKKFSSINELKKISGIGSAKFDKIKNLITV